MLTAPMPHAADTAFPGDPPASGPPPGQPAYGQWRLAGDGWSPEDGGMPPGYLGWGVPMGEIIFDLFDLAGPGETHPRAAGSVERPAGDPGPLLSAGVGASACEDALPPPGEPMLSAVLGVTAMGDEDCLALVAQATRSIARWQGVLARAQARFADLRPPEPADERDAAYCEFAADELACVLGVSPGSAAHKLATAHTLATKLPATLDALEAGTIDYSRATAMAEVTAPLSAEHARAVEDTVLAGGARPSPSAFRQAARRAALKVDPDGAEDRRRHAQADRYVHTRPMEDGAAELGVKLPAELSEAIYDRVDGLARKAAGPDEPRTMDQLRADVATDLLLGNDRENMAVEVQVTVPLTTLLGLAADPGELEGYGPIPAGLARELSENATWRRIITDPVDGTVLDVGRRRHPSAQLARHVQARDKTCRFPGCTKKARKSDIDHTRRHVDGGTTHDGQLAVLCRHHHRLKDEKRQLTGWSLTQPEPGHLEWTSPTGRIYRVGPTPADHDPPHAPGNAGTDGGVTAPTAVPAGVEPPSYDGDPPF